MILKKKKKPPAPRDLSAGVKTTVKQRLRYALPAGIKVRALKSTALRPAVYRFDEIPRR